MFSLAASRVLLVAVGPFWVGVPTLLLGVRCRG
jgi:hypothetical protein